MEIKPLFKTKEAMSVCIFFADWTRGCRVKNREGSEQDNCLPHVISNILGNILHRQDK